MKKKDILISALIVIFMVSAYVYMQHQVKVAEDVVASVAREKSVNKVSVDAGVLKKYDNDKVSGNNRFDSGPIDDDFEETESDEVVLD